MAARLRPARPAEVPALERLMVDATAAWGYPEEFMVEVRAHAAVDPAAVVEGRCLVVADDGRVLGFATVEPPEQGRSELTDLFVDPERWREGIGRRLARGRGGPGRRSGAVTMWTVGGPALPFYRRMGFRAVGEVATPLGPPGRLIELSLQAAVGR